MRRFNHIFSLFLLLASHVVCHGQVVQIDRHFDFIKLDQVVEVWEDTTKSVEFDDIMSSSFPFYRHNQNTLNFGYQNSYFWIRFVVENTDSVWVSTMLEVENPHINKLQLFEVSSNRITSFPMTGDNLPFPTRQIDHPHFLFELESGPLASTTYYLWIDKHGEQVQCPLRLSSVKSFTSHSTDVSIFWGVLIGILILFVMLSTMIFIFYQRKISFYYWGYAVSSCIFLIAHTGIGFQYLWSYSTWWQSAARPTLAPLLYIFFLLFTRSFLDIPKTSNLLNRFTQVLIGVLLIHIFILWIQHPFLSLIDNYWYHPAYYSGETLLTFMKSLGLVAVVSLTSILAIGIYYFIRDRKLESLWFMMSAAMLFIGAVSTIFVFSGSLPANLVTKNLPILTSSFETLILAVLLANRWSVVYKENAVMSLELAASRQRSAMNLIEGQLQERKRLSQQLHDGISTTLANMRLRLSIFNDQSDTKSDDLMDLEAQLERTGKDIRKISHDLSPVLLERYGLIPALEELIEINRNSNPNVIHQFDSNTSDLGSVPEYVQKTVFYTVKEILHNIEKHSEASEVKLMVTYHPKLLSLTFEDDGKGYDPLQPTEGIGLNNLISRIDLLGGRSIIKYDKDKMIHHFEIPIE